MGEKTETLWEQILDFLAFAWKQIVNDLSEIAGSAAQMLPDWVGFKGYVTHLTAKEIPKVDSDCDDEENQ